MHRINGPNSADGNVDAICFRLKNMRNVADCNEYCPLLRFTIVLVGPIVDYR